MQGTDARASSGACNPDPCSQDIVLNLSQYHMFSKERGISHFINSNLKPFLLQTFYLAFDCSHHHWDSHCIRAENLLIFFFPAISIPEGAIEISSNTLPEVPSSLSCFMIFNMYLFLGCSHTNLVPHFHRWLKLHVVIPTRIWPLLKRRPNMPNNSLKGLQVYEAKKTISVFFPFSKPNT